MSATPLINKIQPTLPSLSWIVDQFGDLIGFEYPNGQKTMFPAGAVDSGLTAFATGGQASGLRLNYRLSQVSTVATAGDSVVLPISLPGQSMTVINSGAAALAVFPNGSETINGLAASASVTLPANSTATFVCAVQGTWFVDITADVSVAAVYNTNSATIDTIATAANFTGSTTMVVLNMTGALGAGKALTVPSVATLVAAIPNAQPGTSYLLRIINSSSGNFAWTVTTATGWTLTGTMTIAQNTYRDFILTLTSLSAVTLQSVGVGTI